LANHPHPQNVGGESQAGVQVSKYTRKNILGTETARLGDNDGGLTAYLDLEPRQSGRSVSTDLNNSRSKRFQYFEGGVAAGQEQGRRLYPPCFDGDGTPEPARNRAGGRDYLAGTDEYRQRPVHRFLWQLAARRPDNLRFRVGCKPRDLLFSYGIARAHRDDRRRLRDESARRL
jgi:hypothetical protein